MSLEKKCQHRNERILRIERVTAIRKRQRKMEPDHNVKERKEGCDEAVCYSQNDMRQ